MGRPPTPAADRPRRFYREATAGERDGGFTVLLDGRGAKTPAGAPLVVPTERLARLLAAEWDAQGESIDYAAMPANRLAATVIDRTLSIGGPLAQEVARYAGSDVLCYRAEGPAALVEEEARAWTPLLDWARESLGADLQPVEGIIHRPQSPDALSRVEALVAALEPFRQAGVAYAAPLYGSAILALAVERGRLSAGEAFDLSRLDEAFQEARWGVDAEAAARTARLREEVAMLGRWFEAL
jgi:chaperone required for assembly of F1-ATPase